MKPVDGAEIRRIVLIRTDRVGDLVLSTPAIGSFRRSWPSAHVTMVVTDYTEPVVRHNPDVDSIVVIGSKGSPAARAAIVAASRDADLVAALAPRTPDYVYAAWTRAPRRIGYVYRRRYLSRLAAAVMLTDHCISDADPAIADRHPERPVAHEVQQVQALVRLAGGSTIVDELVLRVHGDDDAFARSCVPDGAIAVNLAPRWFLPNFGIDAMIALLRRLASERRDIVVTYGNDVPDAAARLRDAVLAPNVTWLGELPLLRWAAVLGRCGVVVTVDTGATHVASAMGIPVVVAFERTYFRLSSQEWAPWRVPSVMLCKPPDGAKPDALVEDLVAAAEEMARVGARRQS